MVSKTRLPEHPSRVPGTRSLNIFAKFVVKLELIAGRGSDPFWVADASNLASKRLVDLVVDRNSEAAYGHHR
jgi:hypothetical protein